VEFPARIGQWQWYVSLLDVATERALGLDGLHLVGLQPIRPEMVNANVAYYASQQTGESPHSPTSAFQVERGR
jgi:hypothetical protein